MEPTEAAPEEKEAAQLPYCRQQVLLLLLILVAPVPAGDSRAIWRSQKPAALAAHSRHPLPTQHHYKHSTLYFYTFFPAAGFDCDSWRCDSDIGRQTRTETHWEANKKEEKGKQTRKEKKFR